MFHGLSTLWLCASPNGGTTNPVVQIEDFVHTSRSGARQQTIHKVECVAPKPFAIKPMPF